MHKLILSFLFGFSIFCGANAMPPQQYTLDGGYTVQAFWNEGFAVQTEYSYATPTPQQIGYTVYLELSCRITRLADGAVSHPYLPRLGLSGSCDLLNDAECTIDIAKAEAQEFWKNNADYICWTTLQESWNPARAAMYF